MPETTYREQAAAALTDYAGDSALTVAAALEALEPLFVVIDEKNAPSKFAETLEDVRDVVIGEAKNGIRVVQENLKSDGPLLTGVNDAVNKATGFIGKHAAEFRKQREEGTEK